jgi:hypothetical protein
VIRSTEVAAIVRSIVRVVVPGVVLGAVLSAACADLGGLAAGGGAADGGGGVDGGTASSDGGTDGQATDGSITPGKDGGDAAVNVLPAMDIQCATTTTHCDGRQGAECCLTATGTSSLAARELGTLVAKCQAQGAANCGSYVAAGPDFTMKFPQSCARSIDCAANTVCCAVSLDTTNRLATELASISCVPAGTCATTGRTLCDSPADCPATLNCLSETDPVLSKLYASWCRGP